MNVDLRQYQREGVHFLQQHPRAFLCDEPGLGKTAQLIRASTGKTLVVAPAMVLDGGTWREEIAKWADDPDRFTCAPYTSICHRIKTANGGSKPLPIPRPQYAGHFDTVILDESHYIKGRKTTWTKALQAICHKAKRVYLATGTPIPNWAHEVFTALQVLNPEQSAAGQRLGSYWRWAGQWFDTRPTRWSQGKPAIGGMLACTPECEDLPPWDPCEHYHKFVEANLGGQFLQRLRDDVLTDLPPLTEQRVDCPMVPAQAKAYRELKKQFVTEVAGQEVVAWSPSALNVKLAKVCTGLETVACGGRGSGKLDRLRFDLAGRSRPTVVFAHFRASVEAAYAVAQDLGLRAAYIHGATSRTDRTQIIQDFKANRLDVLVGSLETLAEGLTLVQADMAIFVEKSFKPSRNIQAMRRVHRLGQDRPVTILDYVAPGTVDERVRALLESKTDHQMRTLTAARFAQLL